MPSIPGSREAARAEVLTSRENRWLKRFRQALQGGKGDDDGLVGVEGAHLVEEAFRSGLEVPAVLASASGERHLECLAPMLGPAVRVLRTSDRLFASVADTQTPQGIAALVRPRQATLDDILRGGTPLGVVLVGVQDPGNVGTIVRTAEAFGASGVVACRGTADPLAPKALRASAGSALRLPILAGISVPILLAQLRVAGLKVHAATLSAGVLPAETDLRGPAALLIGNEGAGLPPEVERSADALVRIPLAGGVDSLNAAVAAAVLLYEAARQRGFTGNGFGATQAGKLVP